MHPVVQYAIFRAFDEMRRSDKNQSEHDTMRDVKHFNL